MGFFMRLPVFRKSGWRGAVQNVNGDKVLEAVEMFLPPVRVASGGVMWLQRYCHRVDSRFNKAGS
jgi:hypothetical protein